jgi:alkylation response protein AidB-like acyl-CoA dehydrogenase
VTDDVVEAARALIPRIRAAADGIEADRRLPDDLLGALNEAKLLALLAPREYGGAEAELTTAMAAVEAVSTADGSTGWLAMNGSFESQYLGWLAPETVAEMRAETGRLYIVGTLIRDGVSAEVEGGFRVSGHWHFASGVQQADWIGLGTGVVGADGTPRLNERGEPVYRAMYIPIEQGRIVERWDVMGMRGTSSHDFVVDDIFVPLERSVLPTGAPRFSGPRYNGWYTTLWGHSLNAANAIGIARGAVDDFANLAGRNASERSRVTLREQAPVQQAMGRAEAIVRAARGLLFDAAESAWAAAWDEAPNLVELCWELRLAIVHAAHEAVRAVDVLMEAAGTSGIRTENRIERAFRDLLVVRQHGAVKTFQYEHAGHMLVGLQPPIGPMLGDG